MYKLLCLNLIYITTLWASPSSLFWTICTTDVIDPQTSHLDIDNFFTIFKKNGSSFTTDIGYEYGLFSYNNIQCEIGVDYLTGRDNSFLFNAKLGIEEDKLFHNAPSCSIGIFDVGTKRHKTDYNVVDVVVGKSLPDALGTLYAGLYQGTHTLGKHRKGFMLGYKRGFYKTVNEHDRTDYYKCALMIDYCSGKNVLGGTGVGVVYSFTPTISVTTGPVWFQDKKANGSFKWSVQFDFVF